MSTMRQGAVAFWLAVALGLAACAADGGAAAPGDAASGPDAAGDTTAPADTSGDLAPDPGGAPPDTTGDLAVPSDAAGDGLGDAATDAALPDADAAPPEAPPCERLGDWPHSTRSAAYPITVHYPLPDDLATAEAVLAHLEDAWQIETETYGFRPPLADTGLCGPDETFDVFLVHDNDECYADVVAPNPATPHDDYATFLLVDPWGEFGGDLLRATLAHELNHACQAADDWWDSPIVFEMTAAYIENAVCPDDQVYLYYLPEYQARPDWAFDYNDGYETWYMYGASLYFYYLRDRFFPDDPTFLSELWLNLRNPPGAEEDPTLNEPDFEDALDDLLTSRTPWSFLDSLMEYTRWRYYTGERDDGAHFAEGALFGPDALVAATTVPAGTPTFAPDPAPMMLGAVYVDLEAAPGAGPVTVSLEAEPGYAVQFVVQALPGLPAGDGQRLNPGDMPWSVALDAAGRRTLAILALPTGPDDPDERTADRYPFTLSLGWPE